MIRGGSGRSERTDARPASGWIAPACASAVFLATGCWPSDTPRNPQPSVPSALRSEPRGQAVVSTTSAQLPRAGVQPPRAAAPLPQALPHAAFARQQRPAARLLAGTSSLSLASIFDPAREIALIDATALADVFADVGFARATTPAASVPQAGPAIAVTDPFGAAPLALPANDAGRLAHMVAPALSTAEPGLPADAPDIAAPALAPASPIADAVVTSDALQSVAVELLPAAAAPEVAAAPPPPGVALSQAPAPASPARLATADFSASPVPSAAAVPLPSPAQATPSGGASPSAAAPLPPSPRAPSAEGLAPSAASPLSTGAPAPVTALPATGAAGAPPAKLVDAAVPARPAGSILGLEPARPAAAALAQGPRIDAGPGAPPFSYQDELILELRIAGQDAADTIVGYGTLQGVYLPLGALGRVLDLAIQVGDDGHIATGWILRQDRTLDIDLRRRRIAIGGKDDVLPAGSIVAFDGEMYLRAEDLARLLPIKVETSLRLQTVTITTLEPFPFEERLRRENNRKRLAMGRGGGGERWPRQETPFLMASVPSADVQVRAVSRTTDGSRIEGDLTLGGDLLLMNAQAFLSANSDEGLVASVVELGRIDPDAQLLGPLKATEFSLGDVSSPAVPLGLRSVAGRGFTVSNAPLGAASAFDRIALRGVLQDGFEVELYRNDILIGSTNERTGGRYEFLEVPVDFGLNVFRLVFYGPQGQRYEEVRTISVGDGRLARGELIYRAGAVQKDENLFGVRDPDTILPVDFGDWRAAAELGYGVTTDLTAVASAAWYQAGASDRWIVSGGLRSGIGRFALRGDLAAADGGGMAASLGLGARAGRTSFALNHSEYAGTFVDETRIFTAEPLRRATDLDFNTGISLAGRDLPLSLRVRRYETLAGRVQTSATLRTSTPLPGVLVSNTLEYAQTRQPGLATFSQLVGNFDLATLGRGRTAGRAGLGYAVLPRPKLISAAVELSHALDERTSLRGSAGYVFASRTTQLSASVRRDFERFSLALDGNYIIGTGTYATGLRLGFSFGRDPASGRFFTTRTSLATSGSASVLAFRDNDADGRMGPGDEPMPGVSVIAFNAASETGADGRGRLHGLGNGHPASIQLDPTSLPDIDLVPAVPGLEFVPRAGRIHSTTIPIMAVGEVEGTVALQRDGTRRPVSGVRLELRTAGGTVAASAKTEMDGFFLFERVMPGTYELALEDEQSGRLAICLDGQHSIEIGPDRLLVAADLTVVPCAPLPPDAKPAELADAPR